MTSINAVGLLVLESLRVDAHNAAAFNLHTRHDSRATPIWPGLRKEATIGDRRVPLNHASRWRREHAFHPQSGRGGGRQIRVGRPARKSGVWGKRGTERDKRGGGRLIKK